MIGTNKKKPSTCFIKGDQNTSQTRRYHGQIQSWHTGQQNRKQDTSTIVKIDKKTVDKNMS